VFFVSYFIFLWINSSLLILFYLTLDYLMGFYPILSNFGSTLVLLSYFILLWINVVLLSYFILLWISAVFLS